MLSARAGGFKRTPMLNCAFVRLTQLLDDMLEFCFPGFCTVCKTPCAGHAHLCQSCMAKLENLRQAPSCLLCGMPVATSGAPCPFCQGAGVAHFDRIIRLGAFEEPLRTIIHQLKYHRRWTLGELMADWLWEQPRVKQLVNKN